jgi:hypothetical protein
MVIPPIWTIGSSRRRRETSQLEKLSKEDKEIVDDAEFVSKRLFYLVGGIIGVSVLTGLTYIAYSHKDISAPTIRAVYAP